MKKNIVFIPNIKDKRTPNFAKYGIATWEYWVSRQKDCELFVWEKPIYDVQKMRTELQRWSVFDILDKEGINYDKVAMVDADTMVRWDCPNFFKSAGADITTTYIDHHLIKKCYDDVQDVQNFFPKLKFQYGKYFNCGFVILTRASREWLLEFNKTLTKTDYCRSGYLEDETRWVDQTYVNAWAQDMGISVKYLSKEYNLTNMREKGLLVDDLFVDIGYVWHFNGIKFNKRESVMRNSYNKLANNY